MVKPGKGQAFNRVRVRNLKTGRTIERTWKSGDTVEAADVVDTDMQYLYSDGDFFHFMVPDTFEQLTASKQAVGEGAQWLKDGTMCIVTLWNGVPLQVTPPAHMELKVIETDRAARRHRDRRLEAREARDRRHGARAAVHQRRRDPAHRYAHRRVPVARQGLSRGAYDSGVARSRTPSPRDKRVAPSAIGDQPIEAERDARAVGHARRRAPPAAAHPAAARPGRARAGWRGPARSARAARRRSASS